MQNIRGSRNRSNVIDLFDLMNKYERKGNNYCTHDWEEVRIRGIKLLKLWGRLDKIINKGLES